MRIETAPFPPHLSRATSLRGSDVAPHLQARGTHTVLTIHDGDGDRRSWGRPGVSTVVVVSTASLCSVICGFYHKYGGGQMWRHYLRDRGADGVNGWRRVTWAKLNDRRRRQVLDAYRTEAPNWAEPPGKLRSQYAAARGSEETAYKILAVTPDGELVSAFDGSEYRLGAYRTEAVVDDLPHPVRGLYVFETEADAVEHAREGIVFHQAVAEGKDLVLCRCTVKGRKATVGRKIARSYVRIDRVIRPIEHATPQP